MHVDILCSLVIYTMATVAFYLLGAGVLHRMGVVPAARDTVAVLSQIYTQTLGDWALWVFYRRRRRHALRDDLRVHGGALADDGRSRPRARRLSTRRRRARALQWRNRFVVVLATVPVLLYWFFESPVRMVVAGGVAQAMMLPLIGFAAIYMRHTQLPRDLQPALATTVMLWLSTAVMLGFALYYVASNVL